MAKMRSYPSFDAYMDAQVPLQQAIIRKVRALVKRSAPLFRLGLCGPC